MTGPDGPPRTPSGTRLDAMDALLWRLEEHDPEVRAVVTAVVELDGCPAAGAVTAAVERVSRVVPRLRSRVVPGPPGSTAPRWQADPAFDLGNHLTRVRLSPPGDRAALLALVEPLAAAGFDRARPLWQLVLVEGLAGGRSALVARVHHCVGDGLGLLAVAAELLDVEPDAPTRPVPPPSPADDPGDLAALDRLRLDVTAEIMRPLGLARRVLPALVAGARDVVDRPEARARDTVELLRSVGRLGRPTGQPLSPVMTGRSPTVRLGELELPLADLRRSATALGGTINDVFVAAVLCGLSRYHDRHDSHPTALRVGVAISRRPTGAGSPSPGVGNHWVPARFVAPLHPGDPVAQVGAVHAAVRRERHEPALSWSDELVAAVGALPLLRPVVTALRSVDVTASDVPGSPVPLWLAGVAVAGITAWGPRSGAALNVTALSHVDRLVVGVSMDPAATPDTGMLLACLAEGFAGLVGPAAERHFSSSLTCELG